MGGNVYTDGRRWGSQAGAAKVFLGADPVLLKPKMDPGASPYLSTSAAVKTPSSTIKDNGTDIANEHSAYPQASHFNPLTAVGKNSLAPKDSPTTFSGNFLPKLFHEGAKVVGHATEAMTTSIYSAVAASVLLTNVVRVANNLNADVAKEAGVESWEEIKEGLTAEALVGVLKDVAIGAGSAALAATGVGAGVGAVGAARTAVSTVQRGKAVYDTAAQAAEEARGILQLLEDPNMDPKAAAKRIIKFLASSAGQLVLSFVTKKASSFSTKNAKAKVETHDKPPAPAAPTQCACAVGGKPVIIATGEKMLSQIDFEITGPLPLTWQRRYRSGDARSDGWFGQGWSHPLATELWLQADQLLYFDAQGRAVHLPRIEVGTEHFAAYEQLTVARPETHLWELRFTSGLTHRFARLAAGQWRLPLCEWADRNANRITLRFGADDFDVDRFDAFATPPRPHDLVDSAGRTWSLQWSTSNQLVAVTLIGTPAQLDDRDGPDPFQGVWTQPLDGQPIPLARYDYAADPLDPAGPLNLASHTNATGQQRGFDWQRHLLVGYTLAQGARFRNEYEHPPEQLTPSSRVVLSESVDDGVGLQFGYHARITWVEDFLGRTTAYQHDARQDIVATCDAAGQISRTPFDANGHPKGSTDALGRSTSTSFDRRGNLTRLVDAAGNATSVEYNALDLPVLLTDAMGGQWRREYDDRGNLVAGTDPLGQTTRYEVDGRGQPVAIVDALGRRKTLEWDVAGNLVAYTDCSGQTSRMGYDALGRLTHSVDALGQRTDYRFDTQGRLAALRTPDGATQAYVWDGEGRLLCHTDALGAQTRWRYNGAGDVLERIDALGQRLGYAYDAAGRLVSLSNENGEHTRFAYDLLDRLTDEIGFDGRHQRYGYNAAGELTHLIERGGSAFGPGKVTHFERDLLGRLTAKRHQGADSAVDTHHASISASANAEYRYDRLGRLTQASNAAAQVQFAYDPLGQLVGETQRIAFGAPEAQPRSHVWRHRYDALGNRTQTTLPATNGAPGRTLEHLFYGSGHLHQINLDGQLVSDFERDALHREVGRSQGALRSQFAYDPAGRLKAQRVLRDRGPVDHEREGQPNPVIWPQAAGQGWSGLSPGEREAIGSMADARRVLRGLIERHYDYDASGQLGRILDKHRGVNQYGYDAVGRITTARIAQATPLAANEAFRWDAASNPVAASSLSGSPGAAPKVSGNRLTVWQDAAFRYDEHGNLVERLQGKRGSAAQTLTRLHWDAAHQLVRAEVTRGADASATTQSFEYAYDALGRRVAKLDAFGVTHFAWDGDRMAIEQRGGNATTTLYEPDSFVPIAQVHNGVLHHLHTDHLGDRKSVV